MSSRVRAAALLGVVSLILAPASAWAVENPQVGGSVPSVLGLSLGEPLPFNRSGDVYKSAVDVEVTTTEPSLRLSVADGEALAGRRRGHMVRGGRALSAPLLVATNNRYRSLDAAVDPLLDRWNQSVSSAPATIRLSQTVRGPRTSLAGFHKLLLITVSTTVP